MRPGLATIFLRGSRLRCPVCGEGKIFRGWFSMNPTCASCGADFEREPGFFLGSIYINYGVTALLITGAFFALYFFSSISPRVVLWSLVAFCLLFPLWFFRFARSLWMGFDHYWDPWDARR
jgi:uncharacterized protein (DUF983 family)